MIGKFFDYTFYRLAKKYFKTDGNSYFTALLTVSLIQFLYLLAVFAVVNKFLLGDLAYITKNRLINLLIFCMVFLPFYLFNKRKYKRKYFTFRERWKNETKKIKIRNGILMILFIISPLVSLFLIAFWIGKTNF